MDKEPKKLENQLKSMLAVMKDHSHFAYKGNNYSCKIKNIYISR